MEHVYAFYITSGTILYFQIMASRWQPKPSQNPQVFFFPDTAWHINTSLNNHYPKLSFTIPCVSLLQKFS